MSVTTASSEDRIEDDFVILTPDPPADVKDVLKEMRNAGVTRHSPTPPPPHLLPPLAQTALRRLDSRKRGRLYLEEVSNPALPRRSCLSCGNSTGSVVDSYVDLAEVCQEEDAERKARGDSSHGSASTFYSSSSSHLVVDDNDDSVDDDDDEGDSVDSPRGQPATKTTCTRTDLVLSGFGTTRYGDEEGAGGGGGGGALDKLAAAEQTHSSSSTVVTSGGSESSTASDRSQGEEDEVDGVGRSGGSVSGTSRKSRSVSQRRSRSTKAAAGDEVNNNGGSRSSASSVELGQSCPTFSEGLQSAPSDLESQLGSETSTIQIHNMSDHHIKVFPATASEEALSGTSAGQCSTAAGAASPARSDRRAAHSNDDSDDATANMPPALSDLVGGLDSQLRALCRNLEALAYSRDDDRRFATTTTTTTNDNGDDDDDDDDAAALKDDDRGEEEGGGYSAGCGAACDEDRFYDCVPLSFGETNPASGNQDNDGTTVTSSTAPPLPPPPEERDSRAAPAPAERKLLRQSDNGGVPLGKTSLTSPVATPFRPASAAPAERHEQLPSGAEQVLGKPRPPEVTRTTGEALKPSGGGGGGGGGGSDSPASSGRKPAGIVALQRKFKVQGRLNSTQSLPAIRKKPGSGAANLSASAFPALSLAVTSDRRANADEDSANVIEICAETNAGSAVPAAKVLLDRSPGGAAPAGSERGGTGGGGGGGKLLGSSLARRELRQIYEQSDVLKAMWNNHKRQLADLLASRDRETARTDRMAQALAGARSSILLLKKHRQSLHKHLDKEEREFAARLRYHRNEAAYMRRKVLTYLEEKKSAMAEDPKCDTRLAAILDSMLSLHLDRERFLALDLAKQNKINELKLVVVRQQLAMEELKERNADLNHALSTLMQFLPDQGPRARPVNQPRPVSSPHLRAHAGPGAHATASSLSPPSSSSEAGGRCGCTVGAGRGLELSDVLSCERSMYLPNHSTSPDLATVAVFGIGGQQSSQLASPPAEEAAFDASRQRCHADGDHSNISTSSTCSNSTLAEELLRELTLYGPGSPDFSLADVDR